MVTYLHKKIYIFEKIYILHTPIQSYNSTHEIKYNKK